MVVSSSRGGDYCKSGIRTENGKRLGDSVRGQRGLVGAHGASDDHTRVVHNLLLCGGRNRAQIRRGLAEGNERIEI